MLMILLALYLVPVFLVFFWFKWLPFTRTWKIVVALPPIIALIFLWFAMGRYTPNAQDAYAQASVVQLAPEVSGLVTKVHVRENALVKKGDPLFEIEKSTYAYAFRQAEVQFVAAQENALCLLVSLASAEEAILLAQANLASAKENETGAKAALDASAAKIASVKAQLDLAATNRQRYAEMVKAGAESKMNLDDAIRNHEVAQGNYEAARQDANRAQAALDSARQQANAAQSAVEQAHAARRQVEVQVDPVAAIEGALAQRKESVRPQDQALIKKIEPMLEKARKALAILDGRFPSVIQAEESLNQARYNLERTTVTAPCDGAVGPLNVTIGTYAKAGTPILTLTDFSQWRMSAAVPENWLELVRPGDRVIFSFRNYPGRVRESEVGSVSRGVIQGQGVPSGNLSDTEARKTRQTDTPDGQNDFFVTVPIRDDRPEEPLRVGATGRVTIFASGGFPVVNTLSTIIHKIFSLMDYFFPKPSPLLMLLGVTTVAGGIYLYVRAKKKGTEARV